MWPFIVWNIPLIYFSGSVDYLTNIYWPENQWNITYQISKDNWDSWYYFTWWTRYTASSSWDVTESSTPEQINTRFPTFNWIAWWTWEFKWKAFLSSDWFQKVELDEVKMDYTEDIAWDIIDFEVPWWFNVTQWIFSRLMTNPYEWSISIESENKTPSSTSCFDIYRNNTYVSKITFYKNISSWINNDYLNFYIDWILIYQWSWEAWWNEEWYQGIEPWNHTYTWCYEKDNNNNNDWINDHAMIDYIQISEDSNPVVTSTFPENNDLLPMWDFNIEFNYYDEIWWSWIDINSDILELYKWNGTDWWTDIASTKLDIWSKTVTITKATYPTIDLDYWKYKVDFTISDIARNSWTWSVIFYVDEVELIISTWSLDIWDLKVWANIFSPEDFTITVKTVWAWFNVILNKETWLNYWLIEITDWNWTNWYWYDKTPYTYIIKSININEIIATQMKNIDINWNKKSYFYNVNLGANISKEQAAWYYSWTIRFWLELDY